MKSWTQTIEINAPIEDVWTLFNGSLEDLQKIMPNITANEPIKQTENVVGSVFRQTYGGGKRKQTYDVEILSYENHPDRKVLKESFQLSNMFAITTTYEFEKMEAEKTHFRYTTTNKPLKLFLRLFMVFASDKTVVHFVHRVKRIAESGR